MCLEHSERNGYNYEKMTFRWYRENAPVTLEKIRQILGVTGIVSAIYNMLKAWLDNEVAHSALRNNKLKMI